MNYLKVILFMLLGLLAVVIIVQNNDAMSKDVTFRLNTVFFGVKTTSPISIYIIVFFSFLLGVVLTGLYGILDRFRIRRKIRVLNKELQEKDRELNSLRNLPITSDDVATIKTESALEE
jgi:putative membrane protein